ncbi:MAG: hydrolase [Gammaproteobacteria bacterium]|nr:hydrolase [Gammaproteobacteria bacterium]
MIKKSTFKPIWYLKNPHAQTLLANLIHPHCPQVSYDTVALPDGDTLEIARGTATGPNTVLLLHGLEGSLRSAYAQRLINTLNKQNIPVVFMFFRGCNGKPNNKIRSYHSGETEDLKSVINHLKKSGSEKIALVGYSLGGNITLKYMGEQQTDDAIICATAISVPLVLSICAERMNRGFSRIYQYGLMRRLIKKVQQKQDLLSAAGMPDKPESLKTFVEFDNSYTAPSHGFDDAQHYYQCCSSRQFLNGIKKPTLMIHSKDDPFMTEAVIPDENEISAKVTLELSDNGGHVGFISGKLMKPEFWLEKRILDFIQIHL